MPTTAAHSAEPDRSDSNTASATMTAEAIANYRDRKVLAAVVFLAFALRMLLVFAFSTYVVEPGWQYSYETGSIAKSIATGHGFSSPFREPSGPTAWLNPVYPFLEACLFRLFGLYSTQAAVAERTLNCLFSALTCVPLFYLAKRVFGRGTGYVAALALALYPPSIWHAITTFWDTTLFTFVLTMFLCWMHHIPLRFRVSNAVMLGLFTGFVALVNPVIIAFLPLLILWLLTVPTAALRRRVAVAVAVGVSASIVLVPWVLRNDRVLGRPMLRSNLGVELNLGNNDRAYDALHSAERTVTQVILATHPSANKQEFSRYVELGEVEYADRCFDKGKAWIFENPGKFLQVTGLRVWYFWMGEWAAEDSWSGNLQTGLNLKILKRLFHILPIPFLAFGIAVACRTRLPISGLLAFLLVMPAVYYVTHVTQRYRFPIEPVVLVFAAYAVCELAAWMRRLVLFAPPQTGLTALRGTLFSHAIVS